MRLIFSRMRLFLCCIICSISPSCARAETKPKKVGLCIVATGKYLDFAKKLIESARVHFLPDDHVTYFVFSDTPVSGENIVYIHQDKLPWPHATMMRFDTYYRNKEVFEGCEYVFALDADMLFVSRVGREILSNRVATLHPGYAVKRPGVMQGDFETRKICRAFVPKHKRKQYFAGGFYGGTLEEFNRVNKACSSNIEYDLREKKLIAKWHDESHLNWYFAHFSPTKVLSPSYCYTSSRDKARSWGLEGKYKPRLLALEKNHLEYQQ